MSEKVSSKGAEPLSKSLFNFAARERTFILIIASVTILCAIVYPYPQIAMWVGFGLAGYSAIANDSIQTIGTFIASNSQRKWWYLWLYMGLIFVITVTYSWVVYNGDVSHERLTTKGLDQAPTSFAFLQLAAPIILLILTRMRMPVSTTFLLINVFSEDVGTVSKVVSKSLAGYFLAFGMAIVVWFIVSKFVTKYIKGKPKPYWLVLQWITSGALWSVWIIQDAANIAVFLPRSLSLPQFLAFTIFIFLGLGLLFYLKGDKIQGIVNEKSGVRDVRAATLVDFIYAIILFYFKIYSSIPMSTTWVFIGLLGGRELAISLAKTRAKRRSVTVLRSLRMLGSDAFKAFIGLLVSMILAMMINDKFREEVLGMFG